MNKSQLKKRIIIGSANFTQRYGADSTKVNIDEIKKILNLAKKNKIYEIDSAEAYLKDKKMFIGTNKKFIFSTKILPDAKWESLEYCQAKLEKHFKIFNFNNINVVFFHDFKILFSKNGHKIFAVSRLGFSLKFSTLLKEDFS